MNIIIKELSELSGLSELNMNRYIIEAVLSQTNNRKLFQILHLKKLNENDYVLPKIIKFKKYFSNLRDIPYRRIYIMEEIIWLNKFIVYDPLFKEDDILYHPIYYGQLDIIIYLYKNIPDLFVGQLIPWAAQDGQLHIIKYFYKEREINKKSANFFGWDHDALENSFQAYSCQYHVFKWLFKKMDMINTDDETLQELMNSLAINGRLKFIKYVFKKVKDFNIRINLLDTLCYAIDQGYLNIIKWFYKKMPEKFRFNLREIFRIVVKSGHLYILRWLYDIFEVKCYVGPKYKKELISLAKKYEYENIVAFLRAQK